MKYLCLAYGDMEKMNGLSEERMQAIGKACQPYMEDLQQSAALILDNGLENASTVLRPGNGKTSVTDGPFIETKEQIGGVFLFEARDLNEAIRIASKHPAAHLNGDLGWGIEIRPIAEF